MNNHAKEIKQRPVRTSSGDREDPAVRGRKPERNRWRNRKGICSGASRPVGNGFLKAVFETKPAIDVLPVLSEASYRYLYESAKNYAGLVGREWKLKYDPKDFRSLDVAFSKTILEKDEYANINEKNMRPYFTIYKILCKNTLIYIPASCIDIAEGQFREILVSFLSHLEKAQNMDNFINSNDFEYLKDELDYYEYNPKEAEDNAFADQCKAYVSGHVKEVFEEIGAKPKYDFPALEKHINEYSPNERECDLLVQLKDGVRYLKSGNSMMYRIEQELDEDYTDDEDYSLSQQQIMRIVYDDDEILSWVIEGINNISQGYGSYVKLGEVHISPTTKRPIQYDKDAHHFFNWVLKLIETIYDYTDEPNRKSE